MKKESTVNNYIYNLIYQFFQLFAPILVTPYIARTLGEANIGIYSYYYSILTYFMMFAAMGFHNYSQRLVASHQCNKHQQSIDFIETIIAKTITTLLSLLLFIIYILFFVNSAFGAKLCLILIIEIISVVFDVSFFIQGNEEFKITVISYSLIRLISYILVFIFVKNEDDLLKYAMIQSISLLLANFSLWIYLPKYLEKVPLKEINIKKHIIPSLVLFLPTIASTISASINKTLIGSITFNDIESGNFEYADKFIREALMFVTALSTVLVPKNSKYYADGNIMALNKTMSISLRFVLFLSIALMFGCFSISNNLIPWFVGDKGFDNVSNLMKVMSPLVLFAGINSVLGMQYLIPIKKDKIYNISMIINCISNILFGFVLINRLNAYGAAIAVVISELITTLYLSLFVYKTNKHIVITYKYIFKYLISGLFMCVVCCYLSSIFKPGIINTLIIVVAGAIIYFIGLIILKDSFVYYIIKELKDRLTRRFN